MNELLEQVWALIERGSHLSPLYLLVICGLLFIPLAKCFPGNLSQPLLHKGMVPDALYWLLAPPVIYSQVGSWLSQLSFRLLVDTGLYSYDSVNRLSEGLPPFADLPVLLQALLILLIMDVLQYWMHRMFHSDAFWRFHAVHHSAINVDWLTSLRFHPVDIVLHSTCVYVVVFALGFSPEAWLVLYPINLFYSLMVHANLNWTFGPFRYLLVSPVWHRWHHTYAEEGGNNNFAPTFPFIDLMFGTYYNPRDVQPVVFGTPHDPISDTNIIDQLIYPFCERAEVGSGLAAAHAPADYQTG
jgi:sterol desaturase/sphingolipid hydroxylase (fatty acid hydroxylase superfamily)